MTREEFRYAVPDIINHRTWGYGELFYEQVEKGRFSAGYRHLDKHTSYGTFGNSWKEVFDDLIADLTLEKHIIFGF